jgi:hypothetical protein
MFSVVIICRKIHWVLSTGEGSHGLDQELFTTSLWSLSFGESDYNTETWPRTIAPTKLSILIQWQSKIVDPVTPSFPLFLCSFYILVIIVVALNIAEILLDGR